MESVVTRVPPLLFVVITLGAGMLLYWRYEGREPYAGDPLTPARTGSSRHDTAQDEARAVVSDLRPLYDNALADRSRVSAFLAELTRRVQSMSSPRALAFDAANYTTKLLIARLKDEDSETGHAIFTAYVDELLPHTGLSPKSLDVASNALVLPQREKIFPKVEAHILGAAFDIRTIEHPLLLYNLACYYAVISDKPRMLRAVELAVLHGKKKEQFLADADFTPFKADPEFLSALDRAEAPARPAQE